MRGTKFYAREASPEPLPGGDGELVSVVIPAYNAAATLDETLSSVRGQTHRALDIIVVDDGSRDETVAIARRHAAEDPRVRIITQENAGVAAARNTGWASAASDYIAFVDADDLWRSSKIARQLEALKADDAVGLVYCWFQIIDAANTIIDAPKPRYFAGDVLDDICCGNFIGNGSSVLVRRHVLEAVGGFEPGLRAKDAQGSEDYLFYCRVAEKFAFALVPDYLVGYRYIDGNMSADGVRMVRSVELVIEEVGSRHPEKRPLLMSGFRAYVIWRFYRAVATRDLSVFVMLLGYLALRYPLLMLRIGLLDVPALGMRRLRSGGRRKAQGEP